MKGYLLTRWLPIASILFNIKRIWNSQFKCKYLKNRKIFLNFLFHFWNLHHILNILKKKMIIIANVFPKFHTVKNFDTPLYKKRRFGTRLDSRHVKVSRILAKSPSECFYQFFSSIWRKFIWKIYPLVCSNLHQILNHLKKKMIVIANVFPKLKTGKNFLTPLCKKCCFGTRLDSRHVKMSPILAKSLWQCFYHVFSSIWKKLI